LGEKVAAANGRPDLKDDLISIGEEALWRAWQSYDPQRAKWPTYAENRVWWAMKHWIEKELHTRRKHPVIEIELDEEVEGKVPGAEDLMIMQLEGEEIQRAVQCLTERQQKILELVYTRGLSVTGVAKGMGLGRTTVSNELNSALRQIRKTLKF
jgi:RNA polymerase sigma factor (sigma-70 family)